MSDRLNAADVCTRNVAVVEPDVALNEAARLMRERHVGCLVVVERSEHGPCATGMLTDRDIVTAVVAKDLDPTSLRVGDVMSADLVTARENDSVMDVISQMHRKGVRRMPVTGARGVLVGVITLDDLLVVIARQLGELAQAVGDERRRELSLRP